MKCLNVSVSLSCFNCDTVISFQFCECIFFFFLDNLFCDCDWWISAHASSLWAWWGNHFVICTFIYDTNILMFIFYSYDAHFYRRIKILIVFLWGFSAFSENDNVVVRIQINLFISDILSLLGEHEECRFVWLEVSCTKSMISCLSVERESYQKNLKDVLDPSVKYTVKLNCNESHLAKQKFSLSSHYSQFLVFVVYNGVQSTYVITSLLLFSYFFISSMEIVISVVNLSFLRICDVVKRNEIRQLLMASARAKERLPSMV